MIKAQWMKSASGKHICIVGDKERAAAMIQISYDQRRDMWMWKTLVTPVWQDMPGVTNVEEAKATALVLWRMS